MDHLIVDTCSNVWYCLSSEVVRNVGYQYHIIQGVQVILISSSPQQLYLEALFIRTLCSIQYLTQYCYTQSDLPCNCLELDSYGLSV